ncbi:multisubunit sodium/proton antiporter MrpB subunit [Sinobaca qinghaiensis]|uniref:Multisubunit sodium/proton antiporter MrpB subunit n=1 Tax=Sinobaca qinghaiensis TaxID=342944 RepID=A0A419V3N2_9BACL|nr:Na(+)/H(+) antiporter subunit B [Sinobaca qinghaiensis]RKD73062.1 multisubunit sodium/proton antiporter MrpB subunit [Sinobaca qinghaiensis]
MKTNNLLLQSVTQVVTFLIFAFSIYLFFAGHNNPGGGFIGGLMTASALLLLYLAFDIQSIKKALAFNYVNIIAIGLIISLATGMVSMFLGGPFLNQYDQYVHVPLFGEVHLTTAVPFDLGIYLVVVAIALVIILAIGEDA